MQNKIISIGFAVAGLGFTLLAHAADDARFYAGTSVGEADNDSGEFHGSDTAFKLFAGHTLDDYFALELSYVDAGTQRDRIEDLSVANSSSGVIASVLPILALGESFAIFARLGYALYETEAEFRRGEQRRTEKDSDQDWVFGGGLQFEFAERFTLRAEYENVDISDGRFEIVSVGATVRF